MGAGPSRLARRPHRARQRHPRALAGLRAATQPSRARVAVLRERHPSHRLLSGYDAIVDAGCAAWNQITPDRLRSLTNHPCLRQVN